MMKLRANMPPDFTAFCTVGEKKGFRTSPVNWRRKKCSNKEIEG